MTRNIVVSAVIGPAVGTLILVILGTITYRLSGWAATPFDLAHFISALPQLFLLGYQVGLVPCLFIGLVNGGFEVAGSASRFRMIVAPFAGIGVAMLLGHGFPPLTFGMDETVGLALALTSAALASLSAAALSMWLGRRALLRELDRLQGMAT